jgi:hypothetical protein
MKIEMPSEDLIRFLPPSQYKLMMETPAAFEKVFKRLNDSVAKIPDLYATDDLPLHPLNLHYFLGGSDWYLSEYSKAEDIFFGYVILNNDLNNSEWGYVSRPELISLEFPERFLMINLDLYCEDETIEVALFNRDPKKFKKYDPSNA